MQLVNLTWCCVRFICHFKVDHAPPVDLGRVGRRMPGGATELWIRRTEDVLPADVFKVLDSHVRELVIEALQFFSVASVNENCMQTSLRTHESSWLTDSTNEGNRPPVAPGRARKAYSASRQALPLPRRHRRALYLVSGRSRQCTPPATGEDPTGSRGQES